MLFNAPEYIFLFLPLAVAGYFLLNNYRLTSLAKTWLVAASLFFYGYWNYKYLVLIVSSILVNYALGGLITRSIVAQKGGESVVRRPLHLLLPGIVFNLGLLGYFKYADFFINNLNAALETDLSPLELVLPLAISFFTFQQIAYLVDTYQGKVDEHRFLNYCLFVLFFPQLIAGPIVHHRQMMPQFDSIWRKSFKPNNVARGCFIFALGLFKKIFIADNFAVWADIGYAHDGVLTTLDAWATSLSYSFQLYYDFSAYSDMAIGAALLFNIRLPVNFNSPYRAGDIRDFWRRWHMTLSTWLRDYLYIPMGGNRFASWRTARNIIITFLLGGLWHGAGWNFVLWGGLHGVAVMTHRLWSYRGYQMPYWAGCLCTFLFANFTWVFFRAESLNQGLGIIGSMLGGVRFYDSSGAISGSAILPASYAAVDSLLTLPLICHLVVFGYIAFAMPNSLQISGYIPYGGRFLFRRGSIAALFTAAALFYALVAATTRSPSVFLYFNF